MPSTHQSAALRTSPRNGTTQRRVTNESVFHTNVDPLTAARATELTLRAHRGAAPTSAARHAVFLMGGPGTGKSTVADRLFAGTDYVKTGADDVKQMMPRYRKGIANGRPEIAKAVHVESKVRSIDVLLNLAKKKYNLIYDATGGDGWTQQQLMTELKNERGYSIKLLYVHASVDAAADRVRLRGERTGRVVPEAIVRSIHEDARRNLPRLARYADDVEVWDNAKDQATSIDVDAFLKREGLSPRQRPAAKAGWWSSAAKRMRGWFGHPTR